MIKIAYSDNCLSNTWVKLAIQKCRKEDVDNCERSARSSATITKKETSNR